MSRRSCALRFLYVKLSFFFLKLAPYLWSGPDSTLCGEEKFSGFSLGNDRENVWRRKNFGVFHQFSAFSIIFSGAMKNFGIRPRDNLGKFKVALAKLVGSMAPLDAVPPQGGAVAAAAKRAHARARAHRQRFIDAVRRAHRRRRSRWQSFFLTARGPRRHDCGPWLGADRYASHHLS